MIVNERVNNTFLLAISQNTIVYKYELRFLLNLPYLFKINKLRRMMWAGHIVKMGEIKIACNIWIG
jgi:hypothetical protein